MNQIPYIPETAPFTAEQRAWLNGFLAGLHAHAPANAAPSSTNGAPPKSGEPLLILFGSQTGTAEGLARRFAKESEQRGFAPSVLELNDYQKADLPAAQRAVIISSTWGDGDPPDNAANFWSWLSADGAPRLENLRFAVLGLGDKNYSEFCGAAKEFDSRLEALGARRLIPRGECDVDYEAAARAWIESLWDKLAGSGPAAAQTPSSASGVLLNGAVNGSLNGHHTANGSTWSKTNPFPARLLARQLLNRPGSAKEVYHHEISLEGSGLAYEPGDALGVAPHNCRALVDALLAALHCAGDESVRIGEASQPLREALTSHYEITRPAAEVLAAVAKAAPNCELARLLAPERADDLKRWLWGRDLLDVLSLVPTPFPYVELLPLLRKLAPRLYSISSSPRAHPGQVHLTVAAVRYDSHGRDRKGVASTFLADRVGPDSTMRVFVQPSHGFKLPANGDTPIIMVGPGTGIAPFRAFLEERQANGAKGRNWLFFGDQKYATDFLYEEQLTTWQKSGHLSRLDLAFSRDQAEKIYVQDRMLERAGELWSWLQDGAHFYVCGDAARMAKDVDAALHKVFETAGGLGAEDARGAMARLKSEKRYQRDVY
jgi:sulfite reductase (NADPH) flavoprotein alpha-component